MVARVTVVVVPKSRVFLRAELITAIGRSSLHYERRNTVEFGFLDHVRFGSAPGMFSIWGSGAAPPIGSKP